MPFVSKLVPAFWESKGPESDAILLRDVAIEMEQYKNKDLGRVIDSFRPSPYHVRT
jgi:hypothetical protein